MSWTDPVTLANLLESWKIIRNPSAIITNKLKLLNLRIRTLFCLANEKISVGYLNVKLAWISAGLPKV